MQSSRVALAIILAVYAPGTLHAQQRSVGVEVAAIELRSLSLTGGVGLRVAYQRPVAVGHIRASAAVHAFHKVGNEKPAVYLAGTDVDVVFFRRFPLQPYVGLGAGVIHFDADNMKEPICDDFDGCLLRFENETSLFVRPTFLGLQVDITRHLDIRAAVQMVVRKDHPVNGTSAQALFVAGAHYRF